MTSLIARALTGALLLMIPLAHLQAQACKTADYEAWKLTTAELSLTMAGNGVEVSWPAYPACDEGGMNVAGYELFYRTGSDLVEIYAGSNTAYLFGNGTAASCVVVRAYSGRGGNRRYTSYLEHPNCTGEPANQPPVAAVSGPSEAMLGDDGSVTVTLDGSGSFDPEGSDLSHAWSVASAAVVLASPDAERTNATFDSTGDFDVTLTVTDPEGASDSRTRTLTVREDGGEGDPAAARLGRWSPVEGWPLIGIHAILLPDGNVLTFGTDDLGTQGAQYFYDVWNPGSGTHQTLSNTTAVDFFCSAPVVLAQSGDVLMPGGDARVGAGFNKGIVNSPLYRTADRTVSYDPTLDMSYARWYPSSIGLDDGSVLVVGGIDLDGNTSVVPEIFDPSQATGSPWRSLLDASIRPLVDKDSLSYFYPRLWVMPGWDGQVFGFAQKTMFRLDPTLEFGNLQEIGTMPVTTWGHYSSAAMYEPRKILQLGGNGGGRDSGVGAAVLDFSATSITNPEPQVRSVDSMFMSVKRKAWLNATVLPDGSVFVNGGSATVNKLVGDYVTAELWNPDTESFRVMAQAERARLYHSTSLLLPDGRVLVAGGGAPGPQTNLDAEIYSPPYLFDGAGAEKRGSARIAITGGLAQSHGYAGGSGEEVVVSYSGPAVAEASLVKLGAVTHSINLEQRRVPLEIARGTGSVSIRLPGDSSVAPPGYYMLFLLDDSGTPSHGEIFRLL